MCSSGVVGRLIVCVSVNVVSVFVVLCSLWMCSVLVGIRCFCVMFGVCVVLCLCWWVVVVLFGVL